MDEAQITELRNRARALSDFRYCVNRLHPSVSNPMLWLENVLLQETYTNADALMIALENEDATVQNESLASLETGKAKRVLDLILIRIAADEVIAHPSASVKLKDKATALKQEANAELVTLLNL